MLSFLRGRKKNIIQIVIFCLFFLSYSVTSKAVEKIENDTVDLTDFGKNGFSFVVKRYAAIFLGLPFDEKHFIVIFAE